MRSRRRKIFFRHSTRRRLPNRFGFHVILRLKFNVINNWFFFHLSTSFISSRFSTSNFQITTSQRADSFTVSFLLLNTLRASTLRREAVYSILSSTKCIHNQTRRRSLTEAIISQGSPTTILVAHEFSCIVQSVSILNRIKTFRHTFQFLQPTNSFLHLWRNIISHLL